jgi:hypothetical protein
MPVSVEVEAAALSVLAGEQIDVIISFRCGG